jgi:hypothetical protein
MGQVRCHWSVAAHAATTSFMRLGQRRALVAADDCVLAGSVGDFL